MANGDDLGVSGAGSAVPAPDAAPPGSPPGNVSPTGGGSILSALARRSSGPPVSAPGPGNQAQGLMLVKNAISMMEQALPSLGVGSPQYKDVVDAMRKLNRHMAQGPGIQGLEQTQIGDLLRSAMQNQLLSRLMSSQRQGGQGAQKGGPGPATPGMPQGPSPSLPLPGA